MELFILLIAGGCIALAVGASANSARHGKKWSGVLQSAFCGLVGLGILSSVSSSWGQTVFWVAFVAGSITALTTKLELQVVPYYPQSDDEQKAFRSWPWRVCLRCRITTPANPAIPALNCPHCGRSMPFSDA